MKFNTSLFIVIVLFSKLNAQNCDSLLSYIKSLPNTPEKKYVYLKDLEATYDSLSEKIAVNSMGTCPELLNILIATIDQKQVEQEFLYCDLLLKHAKRLLLSKDSLTAFQYFDRVYNLGSNFPLDTKPYIQDSNNRKKYFEYFIAGGIGMLDSYRHNKIRLETLSPYSFINSELSKYYEEALKEVGLEPKY